MAERLYQFRFDLYENRLELSVPEDVTPDGFHTTGFSFIGRDIAPRIAFNSNTTLGRFVREITTPYQVTDPARAAKYLQQNVFTPFKQCQQEELWTLCLNAKNRITHDAMIYRGNVNTSIIRPAELFHLAVLTNAPAIILAHNHPSGDPTPSPEDVQVTTAISAAGELLGVEVLDHLIIGDDKWVSLKEESLWFDASAIDKKRLPN